jgi:hypothetical protein
MKRPAPGVTQSVMARDTPSLSGLPAPRPRRRPGVRRKALNPRIAQLHLRMTPARKAAIQADAAQAGMTVTAYLLSHLPGYADPPPLIARADPKILARYLAELGKWGSNWNQLTREMNRTGREPELDELEHIRIALWEIREAVLRALGH